MIRRVTGHARTEKGAAMAAVALFMPCLIVASALVLDAGALLVARAELQAAADLGALAGVQDLDYESLADGVIVIDEGSAMSDAEEWVRGNLEGRTFIKPGGVSVEVTVCNVAAGSATSCAVTGASPSQPTVCVVVAAEVRLPFLPRPLGEVRMTAHADASVEGRPPE